MSGYEWAAARLAPQRWMLPVVAMMLLTACADEGSTVPLPTTARSPWDSSSSRSDVEAIKRSYTAFIEVLDRADSLPADTRRHHLSAHMTDPQLTRVINRVREMKKDNITSYGRAVPHVQHIEITGGVATLRDCQDSSRAGILNALNGKKMNRGIAKESITTHLSKGSDGQWRATKTISHGKGC